MLRAIIVVVVVVAIAVGDDDDDGNVGHATALWEDDYDFGEMRFASGCYCGRCFCYAEMRRLVSACADDMSSAVVVTAS
jgi:hypothetical protein